MKTTTVLLASVALVAAMSVMVPCALAGPRARTDRSQDRANAGKIMTLWGQRICFGDVAPSVRCAVHMPAKGASNHGVTMAVQHAASASHPAARSSWFTKLANDVATRMRALSHTGHPAARTAMHARSH